MGAKPLALDLFCKAGGATRGLQQAGFEVVGIDIEPQPRYVGDYFIQADALAPPVDLRAFDFIWASPPCQDYSSLKGFSGRERGKLIPAVRAALDASGSPYCIENVVGSELRDPIRLCGSSFGLGVWRHRLFELRDHIVLVPPCNHATCASLSTLQARADHRKASARSRAAV